MSVVTVRRSMRWARTLSVASLPLVLYGCVAKAVVLDTAVAPGHIVVRPGKPGFVIAAPHGTTDPGTGDLAAEIARRTGFGLVVAAGRPPLEEVATDSALRIYLAYEKRVQEAAQGRLAFYAEIHGNNRRETAGRIEIATVGVDRELAQRLRALLELIRDAHLRGHPGTPKLEVVIEPADTIFYAASGAKRDGILKLPTRALHFELPRVARTDARAPYIVILSEFLVQASTLPAGR